MKPMQTITEYPCEARYVCEDIPLASAPPFCGVQPEYLRRDTIQYLLSNRKYIYVFSFGAIIFIGIDQKTRERFINQFTAKIPLHMYPFPIREAYLVSLGYEKTVVGFNEIQIRAGSEEVMLIVAQVLAQSVAMEHYENLAHKIFENFVPINHALMRKGRLTISRGNLLRTIGRNNVIMQKIISKLHLLDEPDIVWEDDQMWSIYKRLHSTFDLEDRFKTIEYKLRFVQENSQVLIETLQGRRELILEILIILLFIIEIILFL